MSEYMKTTGKKYDKKELVKCSSCGSIYSQKEETKCPKCGNLKSTGFQRTLATAKEEVEVSQKEKNKED